MNLSQEQKTKEVDFGLGVLRKTYSFLSSGVYTEIRHKEQILGFLDLPIKELAKRTGISEQALTKAKYRIFKDLEEQLTPSFIKLLENKDWKKAERLLFLAQNFNLSDQYIISSFTRAVEKRYVREKNDQFNFYDLKNCSNELNLLKNYSFQKMISEINHLDAEGINRLSYLLLLLDGKIDSPVDRNNLFSFLMQKSKK